MVAEGKRVRMVGWSSSEAQLLFSNKLRINLYRKLGIGDVALGRSPYSEHHVFIFPALI